jgi:DNA-binding beta-propeller fold protein YncE
MTNRSRLLAAGTALAALLAATPAFANGESVFNRIASFPVDGNLPEGAGAKSETSAEIIAATEDGMMLVYSDSPFGGIGMIDIPIPPIPQPAGYVKLDGEPTSLVVQSGHAFVGLNTSESYTDPSGAIVSVDLATGEIGQSCDLGGQPDSVALSKDGSLVAVAIENERDEDLDDGVIPQMPAGSLAISAQAAARSIAAALKMVDVTGLAEIAGDDPEPEFVDFNDAGEIALTLQENNHIAIVDAATGEVVSHFSAGSVDLENVDTAEERALTFDDTLAGVKREPDAVQWLDNDRLVIANEGDYEGGSRGFTIFSKSGEVLYESGLVLRIRSGESRPLSGEALRQQGRRARRYGSRHLRRHDLHLPAVRTRLRHRRLRGHRRRAESSSSCCRRRWRPKARSPFRAATCWPSPTRPT